MSKKKKVAAVLDRPIQLGDRIRDKINGFEGICDAVMDHLYQCRQVHIVPEKLDKDGRRKEGEWCDEPWCEIITPNVYQPQAAVEVEGVAISGAPNRNAVRELGRG